MRIGASRVFFMELWTRKTPLEHEIKTHNKLQDYKMYLNIITYLHTHIMYTYSYMSLRMQRNFMLLFVQKMTVHVDA